MLLRQWVAAMGRGAGRARLPHGPRSGLWVLVSDSQHLCCARCGLASALGVGSGPECSQSSEATGIEGICGSQALSLGLVQLRVEV